jgi:hypothetical protein
MLAAHLRRAEERYGFERAEASSGNQRHGVTNDCTLRARGKRARPKNGSLRLRRSGWRRNRLGPCWVGRGSRMLFSRISFPRFEAQDRDGKRAADLRCSSLIVPLVTTSCDCLSRSAISPSNAERPGCSRCRHLPSVPCPPSASPVGCRSTAWCTPRDRRWSR